MKTKLNQSKKESYIFKLNSEKISLTSVNTLKKILKKLPQNKAVAFNLKNVEYVCSDFLDFLKEFSQKREVSVFNLQVEISALFYLTKYDKYARIYLDDSDFYEQKRRLLNRNFSVVRNN